MAYHLLHSTNYVYSGHGDVTALTNESGAIIADYTYDAFGNQTDSTEDEIYNPFRYCGEYFDEETSLTYLRNRYYDSSTGVFISEDTHWNPSNMIYGDNSNGMPDINAITQSANLYAYCGGNPVMFVDPWGLDVYYFTTSEFINEAEADKKSLSKLYNEPIHIIEIETKEDFINNWNSMGEMDGEKVDISLVVFNFHGGHNMMSTGPKDSEESIGEEVFIEGKLNVKKIDTLIFLVCNAGHYDHRYSALMNKFLVNNDINSVIAPDGSVLGRSIFGKYRSVADWSFGNLSWSNKQYRDNFGYIQYTKNTKGELEWNILEKNMSLVDMLKKGGIK